MKAFLQHDENGLFYRENGRWVASLTEARAFATEQEAARFRDACRPGPSHPVQRLEPELMARLLTRAPGGYQVGE